MVRFYPKDTATLQDQTYAYYFNNEQGMALALGTDGTEMYLTPDTGASEQTLKSQRGKWTEDGFKPDSSATHTADPTNTADPRVSDLLETATYLRGRPSITGSAGLSVLPGKIGKWRECTVHNLKDMVDSHPNRSEAKALQGKEVLDAEDILTLHSKVQETFKAVQAKIEAEKTSSTQATQPVSNGNAKSTGMGTIGKWLGLN